MEPLTSSADEQSRLRQEWYNAAVVAIRRCHEDLMVLRVRPDEGCARIEAGQYTTLGLGSWEPLVPGCEPEELPGDEGPHPRLIKRAYSISCPMLDEQHRLVRVNDVDFWEFYIALVRAAPRHHLALTPRLFALTEGARLFCSAQPMGHYTLRGIRPDDQVIFVATGTGEAPHNAMLSELLHAGHAGPIVSVTCVRWKKDLAYLDTHRQLERIYPGYQYVALTTREPENVDPSHPHYVGKRYIQDYFESGCFERETGIVLDPGRTHVFLCGNPDMIGATPRRNSLATHGTPTRGMLQVLQARGFRADEPHHPGNVHFEKYW